MLTHFFGDHKLARCMVSCLSSSYQFRSLQIEEVVSGLALQRLLKAGLDSSRMLRLWLFDQVNDYAHGFLGHRERAETLPGSSRASRFERASSSDFCSLMRRSMPDLNELVQNPGPRTLWPGSTFGRSNR